VQVRLAQGARSRLGLPLNEETNWTFTVSPVMLAYLWPAEGNADVYLLGLENGEVQQLTETGGVISFSVDPNGLLFYYFSQNTQGGSDLYLIERFSRQTGRVLSCQRALCSAAAVSPGGGWLAYQRNESEIWVLPLEGDGEEQRVSSERQTAHSPAWAAESVLSYYDMNSQEFVVYDLTAGGEIESWRNSSGELGDWAPGGDQFAAPDFFEVETDLLRGPTGEESNQEVDQSELQPVWVISSQLQLYTLGERRPVGLAEDELSEDYAPAFSPDGTRLAFTRRYLDEERWTPGRQVWLMAVSGNASGQRRQLTDAPDYEYSALSWHPDGTRIAAVRFNVTLLTQPPEIWLLELGGSATRLVIDGYAPHWVP
jgi:dipeptidyl aminopeptidase/acylaminoacyl peptidase